MIYKESDLINSIKAKNLENFEKNGGLKMYIYEEKTDSEKEYLLKKMKDIDSKYEIKEYVSPEIKNLGLQEMTYQAPSETEIEKLAEDSLSNYKDNQLESINSKYDVKFENLNDSVLSTLEKKDSDEENVQIKFDKVADKSKNQNIKRGLAHSSIFDNALREIENSKKKSIEIVNAEYEKKVNKLENEKNILEQQKQNALSSFDISYATKLQNKIANINTEITKEQANVAKYNKEIASKEEAYKKEQEREIAHEQKKIEEHNKNLQKIIDSKGIVELNRQKTQEKYYLISDYLLSIPKSEAINELKNDITYKKELGSFFNLLYAQTLKRQD